MPDSSSVSSRERDRTRHSTSRSTFSRQSSSRSNMNVLHDMELSQLSNLRVGSPKISQSVYAPISPDFLLEASQVNPRFISGRGEGSILDDRKAMSKSFQRDARGLERDLQMLITAQEGALMKTTGTSMDASVNGRLNGRKPLSIRQIRSGLLSTMQALADVRRQEDEFYEDEIFTRAELVDKVEAWLRRRKRIEQDMVRVENDSEGKHMEELQQKLEGVEGDIREQEKVLQGLRSKKSDILSEMESLSSILSSRLASYTASLQTISKTANEFLRSPHALLPPQKSSATMPLTPEAAIDYWKTEKHAFDGKRDKVAQEADALKAGVRLWGECLTAVEGYEKFMIGKLSEMQTLSRSQAAPSSSQMRARLGKGMDGDSSRPNTAKSTSSGGAPVSAFANRPLRHSRNGSLTSSTETYKPEASRNSPLKQSQQNLMPSDLSSALLQKLDPVLVQVEELLSVAEEKNWNLLVCCIGAELTALSEARSMLIAAGGQPGATLNPTDGTDDLIGLDQHSEPPVDLIPQQFNSSETETEDEVDDPALLFQSDSLPQPTRRSQDQDELEYTAFASLHEAVQSSSPELMFTRRQSHGFSANADTEFQPMFATTSDHNAEETERTRRTSNDDSDVEDPGAMFMS